MFVLQRYHTKGNILSFKKCAFLERYLDKIRGEYMNNNLKNIISFYKSYYKDLDIRTIKSNYFRTILEFDILVRFNFRVRAVDLEIILEAIQGG